MAMLYMNSLELTKNFIDTELDAEKTLFVCVSQTLDLDPKDTRVIRIQELLPNAEMLGLFDSSRIDAYRTMFVRHLQLAPLTATLGTLAKYCIDDEKHVVLLCSVAEAQFGYLDIIADFMEAVMNYKVYNVKEFIKLKRKGKETTNFNNDTIEKVSEVLQTCKMREPEVEKLVDHIINGSHYEVDEKVKKKNKKKDKKKKKKKKDKRDDLVMTGVELLSSK